MVTGVPRSLSGDENETPPDYPSPPPPASAAQPPSANLESSPRTEGGAGMHSCSLLSFLWFLQIWASWKLIKTQMNSAVCVTHSPRRQTSQTKHEASASGSNEPCVSAVGHVGAEHARLYSVASVHWGLHARVEEDVVLVHPRSLTSTLGKKLFSLVRRVASVMLFNVVMAWVLHHLCFCRSQRGECQSARVIFSQDWSRNTQILRRLPQQPGPAVGLLHPASHPTNMWNRLLVTSNIGPLLLTFHLKNSVFFSCVWCTAIWKLNPAREEDAAGQLKQQTAFIWQFFQRPDLHCL